MKTLLQQVLPCVATLVMVGGIAAERLSRPTAVDAQEYHERVRLAVAAFPEQVGDWVGTEIRVPPAALALLKPNAISSRRYEHKTTGQSFEMLIVQCKDARDMGGHYPPVCYPAHGWIAGPVQPVQWQVESLTIPGMQYTFNQSLPGRTAAILVANTLVLPNGQIIPDINGVRSLAADSRYHFYGAGQVQLVFGDSIPLERRREVIDIFLKASLPVIQAMRRGIEM